DRPRLVLDVDRDTGHRDVAAVVAAVLVEVGEHEVTQAEAQDLDVRLVGTQELTGGRGGRREPVDIDVARPVAGGLQRQARGDRDAGRDGLALDEPDRTHGRPGGGALSPAADLRRGAPQATRRLWVLVRGDPRVIGDGRRVG